MALNFNTADEAQFKQLESVGAARAKYLATLVEKHGKIPNLDALMDLINADADAPDGTRLTTILHNRYFDGSLVFDDSEGPVPDATRHEIQRLRAENARLLQDVEAFKGIKNG